LSTALTPYRPAQGAYARIGTAAALLLMCLFGSFRLYIMLAVSHSGKLTVLGMDVPYAALVAGGLFVLTGATVWLATSGPRTGLKSVDTATQKWIDLLIDTEGELKKVSWPTREDLIRSTTAVLVSIVLLAVFLVCTDAFVGWLMKTLKVLPL